jgi:hypothetical protein
MILRIIMFLVGKMVNNYYNQVYQHLIVIGVYYGIQEKNY